jgi:hypothetical protein
MKFAQAMRGSICPRGEKSVKVAEIFLPVNFMKKRLSFSGLMQLLQGMLDTLLPELRKGNNKIYRIQDAAMGAFAVFFHAIGLLSGKSESHANAGGTQ